MNKLCCCADPEVPSIALNVTCACFESHVEVKRDSPDLTTAEEEVEKIQEVEEKEKKPSWRRGGAYQTETHAVTSAKARAYA